jgi:hypothetical protein
MESNPSATCKALKMGTASGQSSVTTMASDKGLAGIGSTAAVILERAALYRVSPIGESSPGPLEDNVLCVLQLTIGARIAFSKTSTKGYMLKIKRSANGQVVFKLSGRMDSENIAEMKELFKAEGKNRRVVLDLTDLTLVDRDAVNFLACCEADDIKLENCPAYIRQWITREKENGKENL